jgi:hypothetical protein
MGYKIKTNGVWTDVSKIYKKENNTWTEIQDYEFGQYITQKFIFYKGETLPTFTIFGLDSITGETYSYISMYNGHTDVTQQSVWSVVSGSAYATIGQNTGIVSILPNASGESVTIQSEYQGLSEIKEFNAYYLQGTTSSSYTETTIDESGNTIITNTTVITNQDGSSISMSDTYDENGNLASENHTEVNSDGSYHSETNNYNENGDLTTGESQSGDTSGNVNTQSVAYDSGGNPTVTGFTINTDNNPSGGSVMYGDGVNTEFRPFDGSNGFIIHMYFRSKRSEQPNPPIVPDTEDQQSLLYNLLGAKSAYRPWYGLYIRWQADNILRVGVTFSGDTSTTYIPFSGESCTEQTTGLYDVTITYDPHAADYKFFVHDNLNNKTLGKYRKSFMDLETMQLTIGYALNQEGNPYRYSNMEVYDFSVSKLT